MTVIKICGLTTPEQALAAALAGADMVGLVFAPSRRQVTAEQAAAIVAALRCHPQGQQVQVVGLFVNEQPAIINALVDQCGLDVLQLSGDELPDVAIHLHRPVMKSLRLIDSPIESAWLAATKQPNFPFAACPFIVDAHVAGAYGGTGTLADWERAAEFAHHQRFLLAGGLTPDNVVEAIRQVRPWGVDVSSGVETQGVKDLALIQSFIYRVQSVAQ